MKMKIYVIFLLNMFTKTKMNLFYKHEHKKNKLFSHNKLKLQPRT